MSRKICFTLLKNSTLSPGKWIRPSLFVAAIILFPLVAHASPFDSGISSIQTLFTGTIAKAAALIAIVIGGFSFASVSRAQRRILVAWRWAAGSPY